MNISSRQKKIVDYIISHDSAQTNDLLEHLNRVGTKKITRVTVSRDIKYLLQSRSLIANGTNRATYYTLSPGYRMLTPVNVEAYFSKSVDSRGSKVSFNRDIYVGLEEPIFSQGEQETLRKLADKMHLKVDKFKKNPTLKQRELERIAIDFSWKSSEIEGNTYSLLETETLIKEHLEASGKTGEEAGMILGHKEAFDLILTNQDSFRHLSRANIEDLHKILVSRLNIKSGYRSLSVGVTGTIYRPLDNPHVIKENIDRLVEVVNEKSDPFEKALISIAMLSYIQGFEDGNKRTARMVSNALLMSHSLLPISYRSVDTTEYKKATLLFYEQNNISYLKKIFIEQFKFAVDNYF